MDPVQALFGVFQLGARMTEWRNKLARAGRQAVAVTILLTIALTVGGVALCLLAYALERFLARYLGDVGAPLLLAAVLFAVAITTAFMVKNILKEPPPPPAVVPEKPQEMSTAALLALLGGIVVGTVLQSRKESKD